MRFSMQMTGLSLLVAVQLWSCASDKLVGQKLDNESPRVWLASAPPEGSISRYTIHLFWGGWDPDGEISHYEFIMTNNESGIFDPADTTTVNGVSKWRPVYGADSTFLFTADQIPDSSAIDFDGPQKPEEFRRSHTFFIRAVDRTGKRSGKPAYRSFTARTLSPTVYVTLPPATGFNPARVPPISTFKWVGKDYVFDTSVEQEPDSVRWILVPTVLFDDDWDETLNYIRTNPDAPEWSDWHWYKAPDDSGKKWTTPPMDYGPYYFAVQVMDEAGAVSPVFDPATNVRRSLVSTRTAGPVLIVRNQFLGAIVTSSPNTPPVILDMPSGIAVSANFEADAENYGGTVIGYRYGWDVQDVNNPEGWDIDWTPFVGDVASTIPRAFYFGTHSLLIEVQDNSGYSSRAEIRINIVPFTMDRPLLLVDDWVEGDVSGWSRTNGGVPSDAEHDAFWNNMLSSVEGFEEQFDVFEIGVGGVNSLPIRRLAPYQNVIWNATGSAAAQSGAHLAELIRFKDPDRGSAGGKVYPNLVALFMAAGGHVLLCGNQIMTMVINTSLMSTGSHMYPFIFRYEIMGDQDGAYQNQEVGKKGVGENTFAYNECCLNVLDQSYLQSGAQVRRIAQGQRCGVSGLRTQNRSADGLRTAISLGNFPTLELRPEASDPGRLFNPTTGTGMEVDIYNPSYFALQTPCRGVAETIPPRSCFKPIYGNGCRNTSSVIYQAPVAFWTSKFAQRVPDAGGVAARSAIWGFHPVYFKPAQVREAMQIILHDEWQLKRAAKEKSRAGS